MYVYDDVGAIQNAIDSLYLEAQENDTVVDETALKNLLDAKIQTGTDGLEQLCKVRANVKAEIIAILAEIDRLSKRVAEKQGYVNWLENYMFAVYKLVGQKSVEAGTWRISSRVSKSVVLDADFDDKRFMVTHTTQTPDKMAIRKALQDGEKIDGAWLAERESLQIK